MLISLWLCLIIIIFNCIPVVIFSKIYIPFFYTTRDKVYKVQVAYMQDIRCLLIFRISKSTSSTINKNNDLPSSRVYNALGVRLT